jgi:proline iminopeptidase
MKGKPGRHVSVGDTRLFVVERGKGFPILVLHGGPGLDHHMFGDYLDPLASKFRLILVDQRSQGLSDRAAAGTWSLRQMADDIVQLAEAMRLERYAVLGHSFGALVALQNSVDHPGKASATIVSSGFPAARYLDHVDRNLETLEPAWLRERVARSWAREKEAQTAEEVGELLHDQSPFHFADPLDRRIAEYEKRTAGAVYSPDVLRHFAMDEYGGIDVEARLSTVVQPALVLVGRYDRVCSLPASEAIRRGIPDAEMVVFEKSGHMTFVEENQLYLNTVSDFLSRHSG